MKKINIFLILVFIVVLGGFRIPAQTSPAQRNNLSKVETQNLNLFDQTRNRQIPVILYLPKNALEKSKTKKYKIAILSHGYGGKNTDYSFIAEDLVNCGYVVAAIQHELPTDAPMPTTGDIFQTRKPFWERGAQNILFVIGELKKLKWNLDYKKLLLIGHSNGGDMSMLFATEYPKLADKIISLDNRRMPFPRTKRPRILSIRSSDQIADAGVLPTLDEQKKFHIKIVKVNVIHNDMWDGATVPQRQKILSTIDKFIFCRPLRQSTVN